ncbi:hypothetical protein C1645_780117 [Glomus cerebriforme]|uniref:DUF4238 domain-containing protein n=1 Tax=Glomus cerebriforme TaxID=658196 RepID=A0A397SMS0_9GLOM|nr:hypothetical protein C1645_780117 [Glomus cerebriforme]
MQQEQKDQYHHYIPRFLLRNFAINYYERIFVNNKNLFKQRGHKRNFRDKNKEEALLQTYDRTKSQFDVSLVAKTYGIENMYKDFNHEDVMRVESKLAKLEGQVARVIHDIVRTSQKESQIVLLNTDLNDLCKFLFIMDYRKPYRWSQFKNENFDSRTWPFMKQFMQEYKLKSTLEVWLQNIHEILITDHKDIKDSLRIFMPDREDYVNRMMDRFLVIWQAGENDEFVTTNNGFGTFEGINEILDEPFPQFKFNYAFHYFYVISPKLVLVLCSVFLREEIISPFKCQTIFENVPRPPVPKCVRLNNKNNHRTDGNVTLIERLINAQGFKTETSDKYTFPFVKVTSATVHLVNAVILNESKPDEIMSFLSHSCLYKSIVKYHKNKDIKILKQDYSSLKKNLFVALNRTHKENLNLRRSIPADRICDWEVRDLSPEP